MSELFAYAELGFRHIVGLDAADHILFLLVLSAIYRPRDWRPALWVISAFTVGHSITLALAVSGVLVLPQDIVEFLIPLTIVLAAVENIIWRRRVANGDGSRYRPVLAALFGLIHGAGFAGYLNSLFVTDIFAPLAGFNIGIEVGQIVVLLTAVALFWVLDRALRFARSRQATWEPFQARLLGVSVATAVIAAVWTVERFPT